MRADRERDEPLRATQPAVVRLPGGLVDGDGRTHRDVELVPLTGRHEEALAAMPPDAPVAEFVTRLLRMSVARVGDLPAVTTPLVRELLVADRDWLVRQVRVQTHGPSMWVQLVCPSESCGKTMEVNLPLDRLPHARAEVTARYMPLALDDGRAFEFRLPTGGDQEAVAAVASRPADARDALARRCLRTAPPEIDEALVAGLEARMEEHSPDVDVEVDAACPECGATFVRRVDLVWLAVAELRAGARRVARDVHALASAYHWSERDILEMSRGRRRRYLALIAEA